MNQNLIQMTDSQGLLTDGAFATEEPEPGSVVLTNGEFGTAWQRYFNDGLWHRVGGGRNRGRAWGWMMSQRNVVLAYDALPRETERVGA